MVNRHFLRLEHRDLFDEVMQNLTRIEIIELARRLPFDLDTAKAVLDSKPGWFKSHCDQSHFNRWLDAVNSLTSPAPSKYASVAIYVCAASQYALSKVLEEVLALSTQRLKLIQSVTQLLADTKQCPLLHRAIKEGTSKELLQEAKE